jgi:hypothetical protein
MGLRDLPQIDQPAIHSAESVRKLLALLNERTGFIPRKEDPDMGCDYMVELVAGTGVTGSKFPLQLKSIETLTLIADGKHISYQVKTSRLGYMINHLPTTGIFVFYAVAEDTCYYDFSNVIYEWLMDDRQADDWTVNAYINIRIPVSNKLTLESIAELKKQLDARFEAAAAMVQAYFPIALVTATSNDPVPSSFFPYPVQSESILPWGPTKQNVGNPETPYLIMVSL